MAKPAVKTQTTQNTDVTQLLSRYQSGDRAALDSLIKIVYPELRRIAHSQMRNAGALTIAPTALVHEAFVRLSEKNGIPLKDRNHFLAVAAQCMRWILIDYAKAKRREKRGGNPIRISFDEKIHSADDKMAALRGDGVDLVALDAALQRLAKQDPRLSQVVELRYLAGLTVEQTAEVMSTSPATVKRDWRLAKVWLHRELGGNGDDTEE